MANHRSQERIAFLQFQPSPYSTWLESPYEMSYGPAPEYGPTPAKRNPSEELFTSSTTSPHNDANAEAVTGLLSSLTGLATTAIGVGFEVSQANKQRQHEEKMSREDAKLAEAQAALAAAQATPSSPWPVMFLIVGGILVTGGGAVYLLTHHQKGAE